MLKVAKASDGFVTPSHPSLLGSITTAAPRSKGIDLSVGGKTDDLTTVAWASADRLLVCLYLRAWRLQSSLRTPSSLGAQPLASWSSPIATKRNLGQNARSPPSAGSLSPASSCQVPVARKLQPSSSLGSLSLDVSQDQLPRTAASPSFSSSAPNKGPRLEALSTLSLSPSPTSAKSDRFLHDVAFAAESTSASSFPYSRAQPPSWGSPVRGVASPPQSQVDAFGIRPRYAAQGHESSEVSSSLRLLGEHARSVKLWCLRSWQVAVSIESQSRIGAETTALRGKLCLLEAEHAKTLREAAGRQKAATELLEKHKDLAHNQAMCHADVVEAMRARESRMHTHKWRKSEDGLLRMRWALSTWQAHVISRRGRVRCTMLHATLNEFQDTADNELLLVLMFLHWALGTRDYRSERLLKEQQHLHLRVNEMNNILMSQVKKFDVMSEQWAMEEQDSLAHIMRWRERAMKAEEELREDRALMIARNDRTLLMREKLGPCFFSWAYITQMGKLGLRSTHSVYGYLAEDPFSPTYRTAEPGTFAMVSCVQTHREIATQFNETQDNECQTDGALPQEDRNELHYEFWSDQASGNCRDIYVQVVEMVPVAIQADPKTAKQSKRVSIAVDGEKKSRNHSGENADSEAVSTEDDGGACDEDDEDDDESCSEYNSAEAATIDALRGYLAYATASLTTLNEELVKQWEVAQEKTHSTCLYMLAQRDALKLDLLHHSVFKSWYSHVRDKQLVKRMQSMVQQQRLTVSWDKRCCFNFWVQALRSGKIEMFKADKAIKGLMLRMVSLMVEDWCVLWFMIAKGTIARNSVLDLMNKGVNDRDAASDMHLVFLKWQSACQYYGQCLGDEELDLSLRFPDAPWPPPPRFKFKLRESLREAGAEGCENFEITLREGSVVAVARGASQDVTSLEESLQKLASLEDLQVTTDSGVYKLASMINSKTPEVQVQPSPVQPSPAQPSPEELVASMRGSLSLPPNTSIGPPGGRLSVASSVGSLSQAGDEAGEKLENAVKSAVEEVMSGATVEVVGKNKFKINGQDYTIIVKQDKALVRKGASWIPLEKVFGSSPDPDDSAAQSRASTPRSAVAGSSGLRPPSKAGGQRASYASTSSAASKAAATGKASAKPRPSTSSSRPPLRPAAAKAKR